MTKAKCLLITVVLLGMMFLIPNVSNAAVEVTKDIYANNGSAKYYFTGLTLDTSHEYEFGLTKTSFTVVNNGKELDEENVEINFWNASNSEPYYQYEKITDENVINKYKEIKNQNGNYEELQSLLKKQAPTNNWKNWGYWNGHGGNTPNC